MTQQHIYHLNELGRLEPMQEEPFAAEDKLQELVADYPGLLSGEQMNPANPRRFILIDREQGIADIIGGGHRWSLDHLLIDQDAIPTLVEAKRQANSEIRREIVGQMLDYAAHAKLTWDVGEIRRVFEERVSAAGQEPTEALAELLQEEPEVEKFWESVETNLRAARLRLLFVAGGIPDELTRVVEFLNEQMPGIEVLAVEIKQFRGETGSSTLAPRVIRRTAEAVAAPGQRASSGSVVNFTEQTFIESFAEQQQVQQAVERLFAVAQQHGARLKGTKSGVTISLRCKPAKQRDTRLVWLNAPATTGWLGVEGFIFGHGNGYKDYFDNLSPILQEKLDAWVDQFAQDAFAADASQTGIRAYAIPHTAAAAHIDLLAERLGRVLQELRELPPGS